MPKSKRRRLRWRSLHKTIDLRNTEAEDLISGNTKYKALAVSVIAFVDLFRAGCELGFNRSLAPCGLQWRASEAAKVIETILFSSGGLLLGELGSEQLGRVQQRSLLGNPFNLSAALITPGSVAGYGAYTVGQAAQVYIWNTWLCPGNWQELAPGDSGILNQVEPKHHSLSHSRVRTTRLAVCIQLKALTNLGKNFYLKLFTPLFVLLNTMCFMLKWKSVQKILLKAPLPI